MGRGSNLLFNPPKLKKSKLTSLRDLGEFPFAINRLLFLDKETLLSRDIHGTVRIYKNREEELRMRSGRDVESDALVAANRERFVVSETVGEEERFILTMLKANTEDTEVDLLPLPSGQRAYDLILTGSHLFALTFDEDSGESHLYRITLESSQAKWLKMSGYSSQEEIIVIRSGQRTILLFPEGSNQEREPATMTTFGLGDLGASFNTGFSGLNTSDIMDQPPLLSPGREDGTYYAIQENSQGQQDLSYFDLRSGVSHSFFSLGKTTAFELQQAGSKIFLLTKEDLLLFNENDPQLAKRLPLRERFTRLASFPGQVVLWSEERKEYQVVALKEH
jgi:hypothetical protein